jgi:hypothetical protein
VRSSVVACVSERKSGLPFREAIAGGRSQAAARVGERIGDSRLKPLTVQ